MKYLKIAQYLLSLIHLALQIFFFINWSNRMGDISLLAGKIDTCNLTNASLALSQESFVYIGLAMLTLAFYVTIMFHIGVWINEQAKENEK